MTIPMTKNTSDEKKPIKNFQDLIVYQNLYRAMIIVLQDIIPTLPKEEKFDLVDQLRRGCKAAPALIAEGFAKKDSQIEFKRFLLMALGSSDETITHLRQIIILKFLSFRPSEARGEIS